MNVERGTSDANPPYRLIALDLDGTLLDRRGRIGDANLAAIAAARDAGVLVVPCTGRAWRESLEALGQMPDLEVGVFVGGAAVSEIASGATLDISVIEPRLALELTRFLYDLPEAVLVLRDANVVGYDYLVTGRGTLDSNTEWWFKMTGATARFQHRIAEEDLRHTLRVGVVTPVARMREITARLADAFGDRVSMHSFQAVNMPDPEQSVHVLEVFGVGVDKWRGLRWIAGQRGIEPAAIAAIGDEINDIAMLASAGCGIAMANAIARVKSVARHVTLDCDQAGVAHAIHRLLNGEWG